MGGEGLSYCVILAEREPPRAGLLAKVLAPLRGRPAQDLMVPLRRGWGLVEKDVPEPAAREAAAALSRAGVKALAVPSSLIEEPPPAEHVGALPAKPKGVALLAAAVFRQTARRAVVDPRRKAERKIVETVELAYYLDVYAGRPLRRLRLAAHEFDFSCLGQRMGFDAAGNFRRVIEWLSDESTELNEGARALLDGRPAREPGYESLADLESEGRWLLTRRALNV